MGNSQSNDTPKSPSSSSHHGTASSAPSSPFGDDSRASPHHRHQSQSRKSQPQASRPINPLTHSLVSTGGSPSTSTSSAHAHATVSASPQRSATTRTRAATTSAVIPGHLSSSYRADSAMASSAESKTTNPQPSTSMLASMASKASVSPDAKHVSPPASQPVDVPHPTSHDSPNDLDQDNIITGYSESPYGLPPATFSRPPRLPLPIEEEVHTPGSPIITPQDILSPLIPSEVEGVLPRKNSVLSTTTFDEDEDNGDNEQFDNDSSQSLQVRVPTLVEWNGGGEKIFVTGTFCHWEKKMKLHRNKDRPGFAAHVLLPPGTHHLKFLVDGEMMTSNDLPTTVDWTNILVNYIEIVAPLPRGPSEPIAIVGPPRPDEAASDDAPTTRPPSYEPDGKGPLEAQPPSVAEQDDSSKLQAPTIPPATMGPFVLTPTPFDPASKDKSEAPSAGAPPRQRSRRTRYTNRIPDFLLDLDNYNNPEDERFQRASKVANHLPQPPTLPSFLGKSILNSSTPHKDDASVLVLPNHTVINHLATSSIKSGVLATSGTTRYRQKFLTTIMYKPTSDDG